MKLLYYTYHFFAELLKPNGDRQRVSGTFDLCGHQAGAPDFEKIINHVGQNFPAGSQWTLVSLSLLNPDGYIPDEQQKSEAAAP